VLDIAYRGIVLNGPVEPEGIVFVDEIELHLHPALQQEVLARLRKTFPKIQFIVSTHSPLVITNVIADGNKVKIVRLELDGGLYTNSTLGNINGIDYNTGLTDIMGVLYRPSEIDNLIDSYVILKLRNKETEARMVWDEIFAIVGRDNQRIVTEIDSKLQQNR
jgi:predicted ATP-binding protein involved in virulence